MEFESKEKSLFELIKIFRGKIAKLDTSKYGKSVHKAAELRKQGNELFAKNCYEDAIELYTDATFHAPVLSETEELALAIANRSAAFYRLNRFKECIKDIDMAIKYGYPPKSRIKLLVRKTSCENELKKLISSQATSSSEVVGDSVSDSSSPSGVAECERIPSHKFVMKEQNGKKGKSLLASQNISSGSLVLAERPYLAVVHSNNLTKYCYHCLRKIRKLSQPFPCLTCNQIRFCSGLCSTTCYSQYHRIECCYLSIFNISEDFHVSPKITVKALLKETIADCLAVNQGSSEDREGYTGFMDLIEHADEDKNDYSVAASIVTALMLEKIPNEIFTRNIILRLYDRILKHFRQVNVNGISITAKDVTMDDENDAVYEEKTIGCGIYLTARLINHSCDPNTRIVKFNGDQVVIHAVRDIRVGDEITFSYGGGYKWQLLSVRKKMLRESYFFDCTCSACEQGLQPMTKAILCPDCKGPVISDKSLTCLECNRSDHVDLKKIVADTSACLKVIALGTSLMANPMPEGNNYELAIKTLTEARQTLSQIVYKTHTELWKADQHLVTCFLKDKRYEDAAAFSNKVYEYLVAQYHPTYYRVFNTLLSLVKVQVLLYQKLKSSAPIDKNRINIVKTETHQNLDLLESISRLISEEDDHAILQRIFESRKLLCLTHSLQAP